LGSLRNCFRKKGFNFQKFFPFINYPDLTQVKEFQPKNIQIDAGLLTRDVGLANFLIDLENIPGSTLE